MRHTGLASLALAALFLLACRDAAPSPTSTPTPSATVAAVTATASATASATPFVTGVRTARDLDVRSPAVIGPIVDRFRGGELPPERVVYADLTGDRVDEAIAIVTSGGTLGDLGAAAFQVRDGNAYLLGYVQGPGRVEVRFGQAVAGVIAVTQAIPGPGEAACCPAKLRERVFQWDGRQFATVIDQTIDNPNR